MRLVKQTTFILLAALCVLPTHALNAQVNLHTTFAKSFTIVGERRLQVRADVFNVLNRKNYNNPVTGVTAVDFGRITGALGRPHVPVRRPADILIVSRMSSKT